MGFKGGQKGKGGKKGQQQHAQQARIAQMENQFYEAAELLWQSLGDWSQPSAALSPHWQNLLGLRDQLFQAHGQPVAHGKGGAVAALPAPGAEPDWKGALNGAWSKTNHQQMSKDDIVYETTECQGGYVSQLSMNTPSGVVVYEGGVAAPNKKAAEKLAARNAIQSEFPEIFARLLGTAAQAGPTIGQKRKAPEEAGLEMDSKSRLNQGLSLLLERPTTKDDVSYETEKQEDGTWVSQVTLSTDATVAYQGEAQSDRKAAEHSAAEAALVTLEDKIAPLMEEQKAKKLRKKREQLESFKKKQASKKGAGKGELET